ncbi:MAG: glycosyltransferase family protein [Planctomycetota bacterium]
MTIAHALADEDPELSILCLTGSPAANLFKLPPRCDLVKLPCITKDESGNYASRYLPNSLDRVIKLRADLITATIRNFKPDVFLVDHTPTGPGDELIPAFQRVRSDSPDTRIILGLRDILDAPERAKSQIHGSGILDVLRRDYEKILVYGDPKVLDICDAYGVPEEFRTCSEYVGFVCQPPYVGPISPHPSNRPRILVTAGGGEDGFALLQAVSRAFLGPLREKEVSIKLVTGPLMGAADRARLSALIEDDARLTILDVTQDMRALLADSDLVISMGGYNSVYEALSQERRLLVLPRMQPRLEQYERCRRLESLGLLELLGPQTISNLDEMASMITKALDSPEPRLNSADLSFSGAQAAASQILSLCRLSEVREGSHRIAGGQ